MEDEVTKHAKNIYDTVKNPKQTFGEKLKDILIEIFIIVFAVTLSIWLHSWSEHRHQQNEAIEFLNNIKEDLSNDISGIQTTKEALSKNVANFFYLQHLTKKKLDSIINAKGSLGFSSSIGTTKFNDGDYEGFKSSGKIGFIENEGLKRNILKYYQVAAPAILEAEKINASEVIKISDFWNDNAEQEFNKKFLSPKFKAMSETFQNTAKSTLDLYQEAITLAKKIFAEINKQ